MNTPTQFFVQAKPLFSYKRNAGQATEGKRSDTTVTTITVTSTGMAKSASLSSDRNEKAGHTCYNL